MLKLTQRGKKALTKQSVVLKEICIQGQKVKVGLTRETFDQITAQYLERTLSLTDQEIEKAKRKGYVKIDKLLLVGGSTYMPQVTEAVMKRYPFEVRQFDPNQAVAKGAAIFGYKCYLDEQINILLGDQQETASQPKVEQAQKEVALEHGLTLAAVKKIAKTKITNVTSKSFGIVVMNEQNREVVINLIEIDEAVPMTVTKQFGTYEEGQVQVELRCMENTQSGVRELELGVCKELGLAV